MNIIPQEINVLLVICADNLAKEKKKMMISPLHSTFTYFNNRNKKIGLEIFLIERFFFKEKCMKKMQMFSLFYVFSRTIQYHTPYWSCSQYKTAVICALIPIVQNGNQYICPSSIGLVTFIKMGKNQDGTTKRCIWK